MAISSSKEWIEEFETAAAFSCRATWSNASRGGMEMFVKIMETPSLREQLWEEQKNMKSYYWKEPKFSSRKQGNVTWIFYLIGAVFLDNSCGEKIREVTRELEQQNILPLSLRMQFGLLFAEFQKKLRGLAKNKAHNRRFERVS